MIWFSHVQTYADRGDRAGERKYTIFLLGGNINLVAGEPGDTALRPEKQGLEDPNKGVCLDVRIFPERLPLPEINKLVRNQ